MVYLFTVYGLPIPKGSMRAFRTPTGKIVMTASNQKNLGEWRAAILAAVKDASVPMLHGPVVLRADFFFPRPKGHYGKRGLKPTAPKLPDKKPDLDKLLRSILDAMTGTVFPDDAAVTTIEASKQYVAEGDVPQVRVEILTDVP